MKNVWLSIVVMVVLLPVGGLRAADYVSLYTTYGQTISYCSQSPCGGAENCTANVIPCSGSFPYKYTEDLTGFRNIYNLNDPKILCGLEGGACSPEEARLPFNLTDLSSSPDAFRIYLPPGTVRAVINFYLYNGEHDIGFAVRYQQPPACNYCQYAWQPAHYNEVPWATSLVRMSDVTQGDVYTENLNGLSKLLTFSSSTPLSASEAGWLYIKKIPFTTATIRDIVVDVKVNVSAYREWYNNYAVWDTAGDPVGEALCTEDDLSPCDTPEKCGNSGFYWYDGVCNPDVACGEDDIDLCNTENKCGLSEFYWYQACNEDHERCHAEEKCNPDNLCGCENSGECAGIGAYWYEDAAGGLVCNSEPACTAEDEDLLPCDTQAKCASSGFYWYDGVCNPDVACTAETWEECTTRDQCESSGLNWYQDVGEDQESCHLLPECNMDNLPGCKNGGECAGIGAYWYDDGCHVEAACTADDLYHCDTEEKCAGADFYWYGGACTSESPCGPNNLSGCLTENDCVTNGGDWHNYQASGAINCTPRTSGSGGSGGSGSGGSGSSGITNVFSWLLGQTASTGGVVCGPDHLEACGQQGCEGLGAWWYDDSCRLEPKEVDYSGRIAQAPVRLGDDADDGGIAAGEGLSIVVDLPAGGRSYALLGFPNDLGYYFIDSVNIISEQLVSLLNGELTISDDLCAGLPPEFKGEWVVAILTVPQGTPAFDTLDDLAAYIAGGGLYQFGSYSIDVHCLAAADCGPGNFSACTNKDDCEAGGGVWHNIQTSSQSPYCD